MATTAASSPRDPAGLLLLTSAAVLGCAVAAGHEVFVRLPADCWPESAVPRATTASVGALAAVAAARWTALTPRDPRRVLPAALLFASAISAMSGFAVHAAFLHGDALVAALVALGAATGAAHGCTLTGTWRLFGVPARLFGVAARAADPFVGLAAVVVGLAGLVAAATIGFARTGLTIGLVLATTALWVPVLSTRLDGIAAPGARTFRRTALASFAVGVASFGAAELVVPTGALASHSGAVLWASAGDRSRIVVTSSQGTLDVWIDGRLRISGIDAPRYFEALVHPAMAAAATPRRVLVLFGGDGLAEREVARWSDVQSVTVVVPDADLVRLARGSRWLRERSARAFESGKVAVVEADPLAWLAGAQDTFDVIVSDAPDPELPADAKMYSRHFFALAAARLAPGGVVATQAASAFASPTTAGSVSETARAAGLVPALYRGPMPTYGEWAFVVAAMDRPRIRRPPPAGTTFVTERTLPALFGPSPDATAVGEPRVSVLGDLAVLRTLDAERTARGL